MKSIITLSAFIFLSVAVFANYPQGRLVVTNYQNTMLRIVIDGRHYNGVAGSLALDDLSSGYHHVKVYEERRGWFRGDRMIYSSNVFIKPNFQVNVLIARSGQLSIVEQPMGRYGHGDDRNYGRNDDHGRYDRHGDHDNRDGYPNRY